MPAKVITYSNAILKPVSFESLYLDTSFIFDVIVGRSFSDNKRINETANFHAFLSKKKTEMWTSCLAVEEVMHKLFGERIAIGMRKFEKDKGISKNYYSYNLFKNQCPKEFKEIYNNNKSIFQKVLAAINGLNINIKVSMDGHLANSLSKGKMITEYAATLLKCHILEVADAFHISIAKCSGTHSIATNDLGFKQVANLTVITYK